MLTNYKNIDDWFFLVPAAIIIDFVVIVLGKYPGKDPYFKVNSLNTWYDRFGIFANISDITSALIGIAGARYIYTLLGLKNIFYFFLILLLFQAGHDIFFYLAVILPVKEGENAMIDVFKSYAKENGAKILVADALIIFGTLFLATILKAAPRHYTVSATLVSLYALCYIMFTRSP